MSKWLTPAEIASLALPGLPNTERGVQLRAKREGWVNAGRQWPLDEQGTWRRRKGRGGGIEFSPMVLPPEARLRLEMAPAVAAITAPGLLEQTHKFMCSNKPDELVQASPERAELWRQFEAQPDHRQTEAKKRVELLGVVERLADGGTARCLAYTLVAAESGVAERTLRLWRAKVDGVERADWAAYLVPRHVGSRGREKSIEGDAWDFIRADWLRVEQPPFESCWRRLERVAADRGWELPSKKTLERRLNALPLSVRIAGRQGMEALKQMYPAQERDRGIFHALEAVNADGHKWDVFARWPDGHVGRPLMVAFQDLYSGKILSWRIDRSEHAGLVRLALGDVVSTYGVPDHCWLDNGRGFAAKWLTGGAPTRYRFKVREEDAAGVLTTLGVQTHWTTPYSGQSKPIERAFRDFCSDIAKDPRFAGAYTGNTPMAKPENYGKTAVPIDTFVAIVSEGITLHNARQGRRAAVVNGRSFDDAFLDSYRTAPIRRATEEQQRLWLLAAENITARRDGSIELLGNRFWTEQLVEHALQKLIVRFDPQALHDQVYAYRLDGSYLCSAPVIEAVGFADVDAARRHANARSKWMRGQKDMLEAERVIGIDQVAAMMPSVDDTPPPEATVVRAMFGPAGTALAARLAAEPEIDPDFNEREDRARAGIRNFLRLVPGAHENGADGD